MSFPDRRGNPGSSCAHAALDAAECALRRLMSYDDSPLPDLEAAAAADPAWPLPHLMRAGFLYAQLDPERDAEAATHLAQADARMAHATPRERAHGQALQAVQEGRWEAACRIWDRLLIDHPCDALALHSAHHWDELRGDAAALRQRPARVLPAWDEADPLYPHLLALYAWGLQENNLYPQAEEVGRRALAGGANAPWAVHAVAHVMEMQGRYEEGSAWLRQHQPSWDERSRWSHHLWWHKALFRLEAMDIAGVLRLLDTHLAPATLRTTASRIDGAALLWRLHLIGEDIGAQAAALVEAWPDMGAGHYAFVDLHHVIALLAAGLLQRAEAWVAQCALRALALEDLHRSNHAVAREVALPLMRGLLAHARGDADGAVAQIYPLRAQFQRLGGSQVQRDLIEQTLLAAAGDGSERALGQALLNERGMARQATPLMRHWVDRLTLPTEERA
ncbi:MAG: tetratricopeptide repeat protein [Burkholderiales bacterium]|nr:tetratricopeptide repeat protein [Burkholderiales bacterium]